MPPISHAPVERTLSVHAQPKSTLETLAEHERRHLPPWLDEEPAGDRAPGFLTDEVAKPRTPPRPLREG